MSSQDTVMQTDEDERMRMYRTAGEKISASMSDTQKKQLTSLLGQDGSLATTILGSSFQMMTEINRRGCKSLRVGETCEVVVEGLPALISRSEAVALISTIDSSLDIDKLLPSARVHSPLPIAEGGMSTTTTMLISDLQISQELYDFMEGKPVTDVAVKKLYFRRKVESEHVLEIHMTDDLHKRIKILEAMAWTKTQIELALQHAAEKSLRAARLDVEPSVRIHDVQRTTNERGKNQMVRKKCSASRIILSLPSAQNLSAVIASNPVLTLRILPPLPDITPTYGRWGSSNGPGVERTADKDKAAIDLAKNGPSPMLCVTRLAVRLDVDRAKGTSRQTQTQAEASLIESLGGEAYGVIDALLETDTLGMYSLNYATLWIKDRSENDRRLLNALEHRLQDGTAAIVVDKFAKIKSRGIVSKEVVRLTESDSTTVQGAIKIISKAIRTQGGLYFVPMEIQGAVGKKLTISTDDTPDHEVDPSQLGPLLNPDGGYVDLRNLFPAGRMPNVRNLGKALRKMVLDGVISVYDEVTQGVEVAVIHASYRDAWYEPA